jgi:UDP-N-acetylmuramate: L-alanyl-gamma-D-glutamyl-meso-diaminopimelate ligase
MTLQGLKSKYPNRRLVAVFEPRSATSRKSVFQEDYFHAFYKTCDQVVVAQPYLPPSSQTTSEQFSSQKLVNDLNAEGTAALLSNSYENIVKDIMGVTKANDLIVLMSNGGFGGIYPQMIEALKG